MSKRRPAQELACARACTHARPRQYRLESLLRRRQVAAVAKREGDVILTSLTHGYRHALGAVAAVISRGYHSAWRRRTSAPASGGSLGVCRMPRDMPGRTSVRVERVRLPAPLAMPTRLAIFGSEGFGHGDSSLAAEAQQERIRCLDEWRAARLRLFGDSGVFGRSELENRMSSEYINESLCDLKKFYCFNSDIRAC